VSPIYTDLAWLRLVAGSTISSVSEETILTHQPEFALGSEILSPQTYLTDTVIITVTAGDGSNAKVTLTIGG
jgi:hypothetical protein